MQVLMKKAYNAAEKKEGPLHVDHSIGVNFFSKQENNTSDANSCRVVVTEVSNILRPGSKSLRYHFCHFSRKNERKE
jgi:hypothetical protein